MKPTRSKKLFTAGAAMASLLMLAPAYAEGTLQRALESGSVSIGIGNAPPWAGLDSQGKPTGAAPEVAIEVLRRMGIENIDAKIIEYGAMIPALNAGQFDIVAAGLSISPNRCQVVEFSEPDLCDSAALITEKGNPNGFQSYEDIAIHPTAVLVTCGGCLEEGYARDAGIPDDRLLLIADEQNALATLLSGRAQVYGYPTISANTLVRKGGAVDKVEIVEPLPSIPAVCGGAVFRKTDIDLRDAYDKILVELKEDGTFDKILTPGGFPLELPKKTKRADLCTE
jgi:polar amino acid transport system substrate-binding protein